MAATLIPHLNFRGQARAALEFYRDVFGGEQVVMTYGQAGQGGEGDAERVIWGQVVAPEGFRIMAFDVLEPRAYDPGANAFFLAFESGSAEEVQARWDALAEGATLLQPIGPSAWSPLYGMLTDRFGVTWILGLRDVGG